MTGDAGVQVPCHQLPRRGIRVVEMCRMVFCVFRVFRVKKIGAPPLIYSLADFADDADFGWRDDY